MVRFQKCRSFGKYRVPSYLLWPWKGSLMKTQTRILDNRLYYTRKIELHRKGKKSRTVRITLILICSLAVKSLVQKMVRKVHYGDMGKAPTTLLPSIPGPLWSGVIIPERVLSMGQIELSCVFMLNWISWNETVLRFKLHTSFKLCTYAKLIV